MALVPTQEEAIAELQRRGVTVSTESVLDKKGSSFEEFKKFGESLLKGPAKGIIDYVGGWGDLYDYLKNNKNVVLLPKFPDLNIFTERANDNAHPHKKHHGFFVNEIKNYFL